MSNSRDPYHNLTSDTDLSPRTSEESPRSPDSSPEPTPTRSRDGTLKASSSSSSSSKAKGEGGSRHGNRSQKRERRMSLDSVSTEGSASVVSNYMK